jgi:hypothetical protein
MDLLTLQLVVTYAGDVTKRVAESGVSELSMIRLNAAGNTEQMVEVRTPSCIDPRMTIELMGARLLSAARKNGEILSHCWLTYQRIQP